MYDAIWRLYGLSIRKTSSMPTGRLSAKGCNAMLRALAYRHMRGNASHEAFAKLLETIEAQFAERDYVVHADWSVMHWGGARARYSAGRTGACGARPSCRTGSGGADGSECAASRTQFLEAVALMAEVRAGEAFSPHPENPLGFSTSPQGEVGARLRECGRKRSARKPGAALTLSPLCNAIFCNRL